MRLTLTKRPSLRPVTPSNKRPTFARSSNRQGKPRCVRLLLTLSVLIQLVLLAYSFVRWQRCRSRIRAILQNNRDQGKPSWTAEKFSKIHDSSISKNSVTEHIFKLGVRLDDYVSIYRPLCFDSSNGRAFTIKGITRCDAYKKDSSWLKNHCSQMKTQSRTEYLLNTFDGNNKPHVHTIDWLDSNQKNIKWINGLTFIQTIERKSGNIAHYVSRVLFMYHMLRNIKLYSSPPYDPKNFLIIPEAGVYERFKKPHEHNFYHLGFLKALLSPYKVKVTNFKNFLQGSNVNVMNAYVIKDLTLPENDATQLSKNNTTEKRYVCFKKSVVTSFLNCRYFVNDYEYPKTPFQLQLERRQFDILKYVESNFLYTTPRDSTSFRRQIDTALRLKPQNIESIPRKIVYIDRVDRVRAFVEEDKKNLLDGIKEVATEFNYKLEIVDFSRLNFSEQVLKMRHTRLAIGVHGANLVNSIFMPHLTTLFEIFPFGFFHDMYQHGGNSGLRYQSYMLSTGKEFDSIK